MNASTTSCLDGIGRMLFNSVVIMSSNNSQRRKSMQINGERMATEKQIKRPTAQQISALSMPKMERRVNLRFIKVDVKVLAQSTPSLIKCSAETATAAAEHLRNAPHLKAVIWTTVARSWNTIVVRINYVVMLSPTTAPFQFTMITFRFWDADDPEHGRKCICTYRFGVSVFPLNIL